MDEALYTEIVRRLDEGNLGPEVDTLVLAAFTGDLDEVLEEGVSGERASTEVAAEPPDPPGTYLGPLTVEGFRGIGPPTTLPLKPGPGLTLVVGRNGSGKSSFAEALEMVFTGANRRWDGRPKVWRDGWRSLHHPSARIACDVVVEGEGTRTLVRAWDDDASLDDTNTPILGLEALTDTQEALRQARLQRDRAFKDAKAALAPIREQLEGSDDPRAARVTAALDDWDLDAVDETLGGAEPDVDLDALRLLSTLEAPSPDDAASAAAALREASERAREVASTEAGRAQRTADLVTEESILKRPSTESMSRTASESMRGSP